MLWGFAIILLYGDVCHPVVYLNGTVVSENDVHQVKIGTAIQMVLNRVLECGYACSIVNTILHWSIMK